MVPFLRSHVRRVCKTGDLIHVTGGEWTNTGNDNSRSLLSRDQTCTQENEVLEDGPRRRYVLTVNSLQEAQDQIQVLQPRYWNTTKIQWCQAKYVPPAPPVGDIRAARLSVGVEEKMQHRRQEQEQLPWLGEEEDEDYLPHGAARYHPHKCASHNTSLAKRTQASYVANFLMHAVSESQDMDQTGSDSCDNVQSHLPQNMQTLQKKNSENNMRSMMIGPVIPCQILQQFRQC